jgi:hypothetical protein
MPRTITQEERQLIKLVEKMPVEDETKNSWLERMRSGDMNDELAEEIRAKLAASGEAEDDERSQANRNRNLTELAMLVKRWRFSSQSSHFRKK